MAASPIVFTSLTGGSTAAETVRSKPRTTGPSSSGVTSSPSSVNPTMSTKPTVIGCAPARRPLWSSAWLITASRIRSRRRRLNICSRDGAASGPRLRTASA